MHRRKSEAHSGPRHVEGTLLHECVPLDDQAVGEKIRPSRQSGNFGRVAKRTQQSSRQCQWSSQENMLFEWE